MMCNNNDYLSLYTSAGFWVIMKFHEQHRISYAAIGDHHWPDDASPCVAHW